MKTNFLIISLLFLSCNKEIIMPLEEVQQAARISLLAASPSVLEAEDAVLYKAIATGAGTGYMGSGYADYQTGSSDYVEWTLTTTEAQSSTLTFRYANGRLANRPLQLKVNNVIIDASLDFPTTGHWHTFLTVTTPSLSLLSGDNKIRLTAIGSSGPNIDNLTWEVTSKVPPTIAHPDHIIFVWMENTGYSQVIGNSNAPYINSLRAKGTLFTNSFGLTHPSYPNYIRFFSGATQGITANVCITNSPFSTPNIYTELKKVDKSFAWYSEGLPGQGSKSCSNGAYTVSHNPTTIFNNVPGTANKTWAQFPDDYDDLENVVCISPNKIHDMHDGTNRVLAGDTWLKDNLSELAEWCITHNSIFVVYFDEDNSLEDNRIPVVAVGEHVKENFQLATRYDHYNWTRTLCAMFNASETWTGNLSSRSIITGCWY